MVVTRKIRGGKKDEPTASTSAEAATTSEIITADVVEAVAEGAEGVIIAEGELAAEVLNPGDIKEEPDPGAASDADGHGGRQRRTPKPTFKVKYASQRVPGK